MIDLFSQYFLDRGKLKGNVPVKELPFSIEKVTEYKSFLDEVEPINDRIIDGIQKLVTCDSQNVKYFDRLIEISNNFKIHSRILFDFLKENQINVALFEMAFREGSDRRWTQSKLEEFETKKKKEAAISMNLSLKKKTTIIEKNDKSELKFLFLERYRHENYLTKKSFKEGFKEKPINMNASLLIGDGMQNSMGISIIQRQLLNFKINETILKLLMSDVYKKYPVVEMDENRGGLPAFRDPKNNINLWAIFKENIGKDLSKITMPVYSKEPITMLQKFGEFIEYLHLLKKANATEDPQLRIIYVAALLYILYANTLNRLKQPFNSLLGETYEYIQGDVQIIIEQVSNHPPILSFYGESSDFHISGDFYLKSNLSLTSFEFVAIGDFNVHLKKFQENYNFERPRTSLHNYIFGTMYFWVQGSLRCYNLTNGDKVEIFFRPKGWSTKHDYEVHGSVIGSDNLTYYRLSGKWDSFLKALNLKTNQEIEIVRKLQVCENYDQQYFFSNFTISMNYLSLFHLHQIAPTDSRLRPDLRAYENGDFEMAAFEKSRLEANQRTRRKLVESKGQTIKPYWFDFDFKEKVIKSKYKGGYFECRSKNQWPSDLFDLYND